MKLNMKKIILLIGLSILLIYTGLFFYKFCFIYYYDSQFRFGEEQQYIFNSYFKKEKMTPESAEQLKEFVRNNDSLFTENLPVEFILEHEFHLKREKSRIVVYINGFNYRDNKLEVESKWADINFFNFLFKKGDIVLFYGELPLKREYIMDTKNFELPENIILDLEN